MGNSKKTKKAFCIWLETSWVPLMEARAREEGIPDPRPGRVGGAVEWIRRLIARELEVELRADPHEAQRQEQTGSPNPHHPWRQGRPFGRAAARKKREAQLDPPPESSD